VGDIEPGQLAPESPGHTFIEQDAQLSGSRGPL
jgi:hypothetical protein